MDRDPPVEPHLENLSNHLDAIDSIGEAHDRFVVGDRRSFSEARAKVKGPVSSIEKISA